MLTTYLTIALALAMCLAALRRDTSLGQALYQALVLQPAETANNRPITALARLLAGALLVGASLAAPEVLTIVAGVDLALFIELSMLAALTGCRTSFVRAASVLRRTVSFEAGGEQQSRRRWPGRSRRSHSAARRPSRGDFEEDERGWLLAAA